MRINDNFTSLVLFHMLQAQKIIYAASKQYKRIYAKWINQSSYFFWTRKNVRPREGQSHEHDKMKGSRQDRSDSSQVNKLLNLLYLFSFIHMLFARYIIHDTL